MSEKIANIINPFSNSEFFFINTNRCAYKSLDETFTGEDLFVDIIPNVCNLDIDDFIVYGNRIDSQIYGIKKLVMRIPIDPDKIPLLTQLIPRSKERTDDLEVYNWRINPTRSEFQLIVMNNISDNSLDNMFFLNMGENSIGFDAEQFTYNNTPVFKNESQRGNSNR